MASREYESGVILRALTQRLTVSPANRLPSIIPQIISTLRSYGQLCRSISKQNVQHTQTAAQSSRIFHSRLSSLLGDKCHQSRWAAVVLIKTVVDAGGLSVLRDNIAWFQGILLLVSRPNPQSTKVLSLVTLTKMYILVHRDPLLTREAATPSLPTYIIAGLDLLERAQDPKSTLRLSEANSLCLAILESFARLLPLYPTTFRPFKQRMTTVLKPFLADTSSNTTDVLNGRFICKVDNGVAMGSRRVFALMHHCAAKLSLSTEWNQCFTSTMRDADVVSRMVFGHVQEGNLQILNGDGMNKHQTGTSEKAIVATLDLPKWTGVSAGFERLSGLLKTLRAFIICQTASTVSVPIGSLINITMRIFTSCFRLSLSTTSSSNSTQSSNLESFNKGELDILLGELCSTRQCAIDLLHVCLVRFGDIIRPFERSLLEELTWHWKNHHSRLRISSAEYLSLDLLVQACSGVSDLNLGRDLVPIVEVIGLNPLDDNVQTGYEHETRGVNGADHWPELGNLYYHLGPSHGRGHTVNAERSLQEFLVNLSSRLPPTSIGSRLKSLVERSAIFQKLPKVMLGSILNPLQDSRHTSVPSSILPILAQLCPRTFEAECIARPRMPVLLFGTNPDSAAADEESLVSFRSIYPSEEAMANNVRKPSGSAVLCATSEENLSTFQELSKADLERLAAGDESASSTPAGVHLHPSGNDASRHLNSAASSNVPILKDDVIHSPKRGSAAEYSNSSGPSKVRKIVPSTDSIDMAEPRHSEIDANSADYTKWHSVNSDNAPQRSLEATLNQQEPQPSRSIHDEDDESDVEIPELNMDPDTDED